MSGVFLFYKFYYNKIMKDDSDKIRHYKKISFLPWVRCAFGEGFSKAIGKSLNKLIGPDVRQIFGNNTFVGAFFVTMIIGIVQAISGFFGARRQGETIKQSGDKIRGSIFFGIVGTVMGFLSLLTFTYPGADISVATFLITLTIIPSRLLDRVVYKEKFCLRQYFGLFLYIIVAYIFVRDFMDPGALLSLPVWAWPSIGIAVLMAINELITKRISAVNIYVNNFWIGATTAIFSALIITVFGGWQYLNFFTLSILLVSILLGLNVVFMIIMKQLSYRNKATLTFKPLVMQATYLIAATFLGLVFFSEPLTIGKIIGIPGFIIAFIIAHNSSWLYIKNAIKK